MNKISIVMAYYNRKDLLKTTLHTISESIRSKEAEIIIVDDGSSDEHRLDDLDFDLDIKLIRIEGEKWYSNPCIPFNYGIRAITGDIVILQNPECLHVGDILNDCTSLGSNEYRTYHTYSLSKKETNKIKENRDFINYVPLLNKPTISEGDSGWYHNKYFKNTNYHFCSAITTKNLKLLGGFDPRYAKGHGFDDNEFLHRVGVLGLEINSPENPLVFHQNHYSSKGITPEILQKLHINKNLFENFTKKENKYRVII